LVEAVVVERRSITEPAASRRRGRHSRTPSNGGLVGAGSREAVRRMD
jgi:hypothetical protein